MKKLFLCVAALSFELCTLSSFVFAVDNNFEVIPKSQTDVSQDVTDVGKAGGGVWDKLNTNADKYEKNKDIGAQFASGAFTWNTLLNYVVYLVRFMSQIALVIGAAMIIWAGYKYAE